MWWRILLRLLKRYRKFFYRDFSRNLRKFGGSKRFNENRILICMNIRNRMSCRVALSRRLGLGKSTETEKNLPGTKKLTNWIIIFTFFSIVLHLSHNKKGGTTGWRLELWFRYRNCELATPECEQKCQWNFGTGAVWRFQFGEYFFFHSVIIQYRISNKILKLLLFLLFFSSLLAHFASFRMFRRAIDNIRRISSSR